MSLKSEPKHVSTSDHPEGIHKRLPAHVTTLDVVAPTTTTGGNNNNSSEEFIRKSKSNGSYRNASSSSSSILHDVAKKTNFRKSHGVQFQKQFESLKSSGSGSLFSRQTNNHHYPNNNNNHGSTDYHNTNDHNHHYQRSMMNSSEELKTTKEEMSTFAVGEGGTGDNDHDPLTLSLFETCIDHWQYFRYRCGLLINDTRVQLLIVALIAINALMIGIATFDFVKNNEHIQNAFEATDTFFLILFTIELGMQFIFYGIRLFTDGWLVFDLIIITLSWAFSQVQIIRAFRIFRAFRLVTRIKVLKNLVLALFSVVPRMFAIGILLMIVSYIFAVMFTQLYKDLYIEGHTEEDYFGRMDKTLFTLFQLMTLDNWADVAREVIAVHPWAWIPFTIFVIITGFVVVNLIIAVICDAISALHDDEKAKLHGTYEENNQQSSSSDDDDDDDESDVDDNNNNHHPNRRSKERGVHSEEIGYDNDDDDDDHDIMNEEDQYHIELDVRAQLDSLEQHVMELSRMQEDALMTLEMLTENLQGSFLLDPNTFGDASNNTEDDEDRSYSNE